MFVNRSGAVTCRPFSHRYPKIVKTRVGIEFQLCEYSHRLFKHYPDNLPIT